MREGSERSALLGACPPMRSLLLLALFACAPPSEAQQTPVPFVLDADTANEMDDMYAIAQAVLDPQADLLLLTAAHFNNTEIHTKGRWHAYEMEGFDTLAASQEENDRLLATLGSDVPALPGADEMIGYAWGYFDGAPVPEAEGIDAIIERARNLPDGERLTVLSVGPLTNVAAAIIRAPDVAGRLDLWWLGTKYDVGTQVWNKNSFNARNDINALDYLLNREDVALTILPGMVARKLMFRRGASLDCLATSDLPVAEPLAARWDFVSAGEEWTMWDLALTLAVTHPDWARIEDRAAPPENTRETVRVVTDIDALAMERHFWSLLGAQCDDAQWQGGPVVIRSPTEE